MDGKVWLFFFFNVYMCILLGNVLEHPKVRHMFYKGTKKNVILKVHHRVKALGTKDLTQKNQLGSQTYL